MSTEDEQEEEQEQDEEEEEEEGMSDIDQVLLLVRELKMKDIEGYRRRIEDRDRTADTPENTEKVEKNSDITEITEKAKDERASSPPEESVFTFDQEDIQASKLLTFDKVLKN